MTQTSTHGVQTRRPNFLLIMTDQQRADHLGAYGNTVVQTPNLDRLASQGFQANRCYVASPACMPNRASLLTGRMPSVHRARHNGIPLPLAEVTFVERLRDAGYRTGLVGKAHLQNISGFPAIWPPASSPRTQGEARRPESGRFDQEWGPHWRSDPSHEVSLPFYGYENVCLVVDHGDTATGHYRRWLEQNHPDVAALTGPDAAIPAPDYALTAVKQAWRTRVPEALSTTSYIGQQTRALLSDCVRDNQPFFLQCSFPDPHHPFTPPGKFWDMYKPEDMAPPPSFHAPAHPLPPHLAWMHAQRDLGKAVKHTPAMFAANEREVREALALNYGSISHLDEEIGRILQHLEQLGALDNTVVIFTSDHGDFFGDHQLLWKGPIHYQGLIRVPLIWSDPTAQAQQSDTLCSTLDLAPTILARAGCTAHNGLQGLSLLPCITQRAALARTAILVEEETQRTLFNLPGRLRMRTLQTARHRLSVYEGASWGELYDLVNDPLERNNLWDDPAATTLRQDLLHQLTKTLISYTDTSPHPSALA